MKKNIIAVIAVVMVVAVASAFGKLPQSNEKVVPAKASKKAPQPKEEKEALVNYYFIFNGTNGQENDETKWSQIDQSTYDLSSCSNAYRGCALKTTAVTGTAPNIHPTKVNVTGSGTDVSPTLGDGVIEVKNKNSSY